MKNPDPILRKKRVALAEDIAIVALALLALVLAGQTGVFQKTLPALSAVQTVGGGYTAGPAVSLAGEVPAALMLRDGADRCGVAYDQPETDRLYTGGLERLLVDSLRQMEAPAPVGEEVWQQTLTEEEQWVFYDYAWDILFDQQAEAGKARCFLVTLRGGQAETVCFYCEDSRTFYRARVRDPVGMPPLETKPNGARFAFEDPALSQQLAPYMLVTDTPPVCPVYVSSDPLLTLDDPGWNALLEALDFNANAVSPYTSATGSVIREGADTLRVMNDGTLIFHGSETGESRYTALSARPKDLQLKAREILDSATAGLRGAALPVCQGVETLEDGQTQVTFRYRLDGAGVELWGEGWAARFLFRDNVVTTYTILMRRYEDSGLTSTLLPVRQAAAAAAAMGRRGAELQAVYQDTEDGQRIAGWTVREKR